MDYDFGGLRINSTIRLAGLAPVRKPASDSGVPDLKITARQGPAPASGKNVYRWSGRYDLALEDCGPSWVVRCGNGPAIEIDKAGRIVCCHHGSDNDLEVLGEILGRRVLPRIAGLHGRLVLHAATVSDGQGAIMLFGGSGAGKSTMTVALARAFDWDILTDDMSVVTDDHRRLAWPTMPGASLWLPSQAGLSLRETDCEPLQAYEGKAWYQAARSQLTAAAPLRAMIFLSTSEDESRVEQRRLADPVTMVMASPQLIVFNPADDHGVAAMIGRLKPLVEDVPAYVLAYPRTFQALPDVLNAIRSLNSDAPCQTV